MSRRPDADTPPSGGGRPPWFRGRLGRAAMLAVRAALWIAALEFLAWRFELIADLVPALVVLVLVWYAYRLARVLRPRRRERREGDRRHGAERRERSATGGDHAP